MIKRVILSLLVVLAGSLSLALPVGATDPLSQACKDAPDSALCNKTSNPGTTNPISGPNGIINKAASLIALFAGIVAVVMIVVGAFGYATAGSNAENAAKARRRIINAMVGLALVVLAWSIVRFATNIATK